MTNRRPIAEVIAASRSRLGALGFDRRSGEIFTADAAADVLGWLGLNRAVTRNDGLLEINVVVGIRHQGIERCLASLEGDKFHPYLPPTISLHLGYLMPEKHYHPWFFRDDNVESQADAMVRAVEAYGLPFINKNRSTEQLVDLMASGEVGVREQLAFRLPIGYRMLGMEDSATRALTTTIHELQGRTDGAAERFRTYARAFQATKAT
jgi:hypothetical protein